MMKVAVIGATGFVGSAIIKEGIQRGYEITAIVRDTAKVEKAAGITALSVDVNNVDALSAALTSHDAVISAYNPGWENPNIYADSLDGAKNIQEAVKKSGVSRFITVGGAGSLYIGESQLVDSPQFPAEWKAGATAARDYLNILRKEEELDWTFVSPAINLHPGERTGTFRLGTENPVFNAEGKNDISTADLAVAIFDELQNNQFIRSRFTLGY
ncbi:hypothetical protein A0256_16340 [Mucilaginibacter sp. PAMC 26640]|nr:hypothetical protein A0256_16340 [Mucilaginibacter sp. PAMC 26640]